MGILLIGRIGCDMFFFYCFLFPGPMFDTAHRGLVEPDRQNLIVLINLVRAANGGGGY